MDLLVNRIICGDAKTELKKLPDGSINCCISSPPYWALRDYSACDCSIRRQYSESMRTYGGANRSDGVGGNINPNDPRCQKAPDPNCPKCGGTGKNKNVEKNQLGLEPTFEEYIDKLCTVYDEVKRVLRPDGTCWVNLGDTYNNNPSNSRNSNLGNAAALGQIGRQQREQKSLPAKSLCLIPQRFAIEMVNRGWILRNFCVWHKPNPMPSSAKDRFTVDWEPVFFFVKSSESNYWVHIRKMLSVSQRPKPDYRWQHASGYELMEPPDEPNWKKKRVKCPDCKGTGKVRPVLNTPFFKGMVGEPEICGRCLPSLKDPDVKNYTVLEWQRVNLWEGRDYWFEPQYEPHLESSKSRYRYSFENCSTPGYVYPNEKRGQPNNWEINPLGRNKRTVWTIPTQPFPEAHFATFPEKLVEPMIKSGCPEFVCKKCGKAREKIWDYKTLYRKRPNAHVKYENGGPSGQPDQRIAGAQPIFKGYTDCGCNAGWGPGVCLDMFRRFRNGRRGGCKIKKGLYPYRLAA